MNRVINSFNVSRFIFNETSPSKVSPSFRLKMIKLILMAEIWPYRTAWLLQIAEDAIQEEETQKQMENLPRRKSFMKDLSDTNGLTVKEVLLKIYGEKVTLAVIVAKLSLFEVYIRLIKVLMYHPNDAEIFRDGDPQLFESLLATWDKGEDDLLMLEDIVPLDNAASIPNAKTLKPFIFNLNTHMMEKASVYLDEIAIKVQDKTENTSSPTSSQTSSGDVGDGTENTSSSTSSQNSTVADDVQQGNCTPTSTKSQLIFTFQRKKDVHEIKC